MKIAVVTGASSGMGREFVLQLAQQEHFDEIWAIARRKEALEALGGQTAVPVRAVPLDLLREESFAAYSALLQAEKPEVAVLVNAAGFGKFGSFDRIPMDETMKMIDLNCKALVQMTQRTIPYMKPGGRIVELDSLSAFQPVPYLNVYAATKAFVLSYTRGLGRELRSRGIRIMAVSPGWVKTEFFSHAFQTSTDQVQYFNRLYEAKDVVKTALKDLYHSAKDVSIHGLPIRVQVGLVKLLPHSLVMDIWEKQQKKAKNNPMTTR